MMRIDPDKPGLVGLLRGQGDPAMRFIAWFGIALLCGFVPYVALVVT